MEVEIKPKKNFTLNFAEIWEYRELFYFFTWRDIKVKYKQTVLGFLWAVLQPFIMMVVFSVFFGQVLKESMPTNIPYPVFVYSGLMFWNLFATATTNAGNSMVTNAHIIKKIYFPRIIIPISSVLVAAFDFLMSFIVFAGILFWYRYDVSFLRLIAFLPLSFLLIVLISFGSGSLLASLNVKYRDIRYVIPFLIQLLLFLTPVIYPVSVLSNKVLQFLLSLNPLTGVINMARSAITNQPFNWNEVMISLATTFILLLLGIYRFRKTEAYFADLA